MYGELYHYGVKGMKWGVMMKKKTYRIIECIPVFIFKRES